MIAETCCETSIILKGGLGGGGARRAHSFVLPKRLRISAMHGLVGHWTSLYIAVKLASWNSLPLPQETLDVLTSIRIVPFPPVPHLPSYPLAFLSLPLSFVSFEHLSAPKKWPPSLPLLSRQSCPPLSLLFLSSTTSRSSRLLLLLPKVVRSSAALMTMQPS